MIDWIAKPCLCAEFCALALLLKLDCFSDIGIGLLTSAVSATGTVREESSYEPWRNVLPDGYEATAVNLKKAYEAVVVRRKYARDTSKRSFGVRCVESSEVGEPSCRTGVRISYLVEVGQVEHLSASLSAADQPCSSAAVPPRNSWRGKCNGSATPTPVAALNRLFEFDNESFFSPKGRDVYFDDPNFEVASKQQPQTVMSRKSGRSRRVATVFQSSPP